MHRHNRGPHLLSRSGMTLIELMSVLVVMGIMLSLVAPRLDLYGSAVEAETRPVGSELMKAQRLAVQAQHDVVVAFDVDAGRLRVHSDANENGTTPNCGHRHPIGGIDYSYTAAEHDISGMRDAGNQPLEGNSTAVLQGQPGRQRPRCYLGGSDSLAVDLTFRANDGRGSWDLWSGTWASPMPAAVAARPDRDHLVPLGRAFNPNFKGVIHVAGDVAISGLVRGRATLATTGDIAIADDIQYATDPAAATCQDILGLFAGGDIIVSDNSVNAPMNLNASGNDWRSYDTTRDEVIQGVLLTLGSFSVANFNTGSVEQEPCQGADVGRGCLYVTGGIIQRRRGAVGQSASGGATGYIKRYSYDQCAGSNPPPYFPTTGYFTRGRVYEVNPTGFDVADLFGRLTAG